METKKSTVFSSRESQNRSRLYRRITKKLEDERFQKNKPKELYETQMQNCDNVVEFDQLCTYFFTEHGLVKAVDGVSFVVPKHSIVAIVGESGCGKSVSALSLMQLLDRPSGQIVGGELRFLAEDGVAYNIARTPNEVMEKLRGNRLSMVFQEPMTSLTPVVKVGEQIKEAILLHQKTLTKAEAKEKALELLALVNIADPETIYQNYPHELSGGMRQRVMIAIALSSSPNLIICDEPTTALDVTIQAQILDLLKNLKEKTGTSILLISHDLGVVAGLADRVVVMYGGRVVEEGSADDIFHHPAHPYTEGLLASRPVLGKKAERLHSIPGVVPDPQDLPSHCFFQERCSASCAICQKDYPPSYRISESHVVACHLHAEGVAMGGPKSVDVEDLLI